MSSPPLLGAGRLRALLDEHGVRPARSLGQNFVVDPNTIRKMIDVAEVRSGDRVLEIGAGAGSLTVGLAQVARRVIALEVDPRLVALLQDTLGGVGNVEVVQGDARAIDLSSLDADVVVANLPYNVATPLVLDVLDGSPGVSRLTVMTQREVGERLAAGPGSKVYGHVSVLVRYHATARVAATVSRNAFYPVPRVDSVIVSIVRKGEVPDVPRDRFAEVVRASFSQRRKTLRNALGALAGSTETAERWLEGAGVDPSTRAEDVDLDGFVALARASSGGAAP